MMENMTLNEVIAAHEMCGRKIEKLGAEVKNSLNRNESLDKLGEMMELLTQMGSYNSMAKRMLIEDYVRKFGAQR